MFKGPEVLSGSESIRQEIEVTRLGNLSILDCPWGPKADNNYILNLVQRFNDSPDALQEAKKLIESTGITNRRRSFNSETPKQEVLEETARIGGVLIRAAMENQGWDSIDYFVDTSASLPTEIGELSLKNAGIDPETVSSKSYRIACSGAVSAFVDCLADSDLKGKRTVICALEPLSQHIAPNQYSLDSLNIPAIFGDGYAAIAFNTADFELVSAKTLIIPDRGGLRFKTNYPLPRSDSSLVPSYYSFENEGESIISISEKGVFIKIEEPKGTMPSEMGGVSTTLFFVPHTRNVLRAVLEDAKEKGLNPTQVVMHQPSRQVTEAIKNSLTKAGITNLNLPDFLLGKIGRSNSSSATTIFIWQHLAKEERIDPGEPFMLCAPGIGSDITAAVVQSRNS